MKDAEKMSINRLSEKLHTDRRTLKKRLALAGLLEGRRTWTLAEVLPLLSSENEPATYAKNRDALVREQTRRLRLENDLSERRLIPSENVLQAWSFIATAFRDRVLSAALSQELREELLGVLETPHINDYFSKTISADTDAAS
jgi:hypothetical protein